VLASRGAPQQKRRALGCTSGISSMLHDMTPRAAIAFVRRHGIVLEGARGPVPNLAEAVVSRPIKGSWWGHPQGHQIFGLTRAVRASPDVLTCRLVSGKVTYVHRRLWPALVRLAPRFPRKDLAALHEIHTTRGRHELLIEPFPSWVPDMVRQAAGQLSNAEAEGALGPWCQGKRRSHGAT
jgi:hypothetical protein